MKKYLPYFILCVMFGVLLNESWRWLTPNYREATVILKNQSGGPLRDVVVKHESGSVPVDHLETGEKLGVSVYVWSENNISVSARLPSGKVLNSGDGVYVEPGYCVVVVIGPESMAQKSYLLRCGLI